MDYYFDDFDLAADFGPVGLERADAGAAAGFGVVPLLAAAAVAATGLGPVNFAAAADRGGGAGAAGEGLAAGEVRDLIT